MWCLIEKNDDISSDLIEILKILNHSIQGKDLNEIYAILQQYGRAKNQERWQLGEIQENKKKILIPFLKKLGMIEEVLPRLKTYKTIIVLGGAVGRMRARVHFLEKLWNMGVRSQHILFLVGERPLAEDLSEEKNPLSSSCSSVPFRPNWTPSNGVLRTEADTVPVIWDQIIRREDLRNMGLQVLSTPFMKDRETLEMRRPDTAETIETWIAREPPQEGAYLVISNNPFIPYQDGVIRSVLEKEGFLERLSLETVGPAAVQNLAVASYLDALFTWFRIEFKRVKNKEVSSK